MGTATTFDVVSARGEFLGGAIAPGLGISAEALFTRAARLPRIDVKKPAKVIGTGTVDNIQIGLYYGYIGLVDGILERMLAEMGPADEGRWRRVGLAKLIAGGSKYIGEVDDSLTLTGLRCERNYERNRDRAKRLRGRKASPGGPMDWAGLAGMLNYFNYFTEIEERFQRRRGSLLMLSTLDWALIETWAGKRGCRSRMRCCAGIDDAFDRHDAKKARAMRVKSMERAR